MSYKRAFQPSWMRIPIEVQRQIFAASASGMTGVQIARKFGYKPITVNSLLDHGDIISVALDEPQRCPDCGGKLTQAPCLGCRLKAAVNQQRPKSRAS